MDNYIEPKSQEKIETNKHLALRNWLLLHGHVRPCSTTATAPSGGRGDLSGGEHRE